MGVNRELLVYILQTVRFIPNVCGVKRNTLVQG